MENRLSTSEALEHLCKGSCSTVEMLLKCVLHQFKVSSRCGDTRDTLEGWRETAWANTRESLIYAGQRAESSCLWTQVIFATLPVGGKKWHLYLFHLRMFRLTWWAMRCKTSDGQSVWKVFLFSNCRIQIIRVNCPLWEDSHQALRKQRPSELVMKATKCLDEITGSGSRAFIEDIHTPLSIKASRIFQAWGDNRETGDTSNTWISTCPSTYPAKQAIRVHGHETIMLVPSMRYEGIFFWVLIVFRYWGQS